MKYNKWGICSLFMFVLLLIPIAVFADATVPATVAITAAPVKTNIWATLIQALSSIILTALIPLLGLAAAAIAKWFQKLQTGNNAQKYATIFNLATVGVKMAEAQYGPNTGKGIEKEKEAVQFLMTHIPGLQQAAAQDFVQAAYTDVFTALTPSQAAPVAKSSTT